MFAKQLRNKSFLIVKVWHDNCNTYINTININNMKNIINNKSFLTCDIYVGTYYKYNCGSLHGAWVDLTQFEDYEQFIEFCKELHKEEIDAEFMIQDNVCDMVFADMIGEYGVNKRVFEAIQLYAELGDYQQEILAAFMDASGLDFFEAIDKYEDSFITSEIEEYAHELVQEYDIPEFVLFYFDYEKFTRDLKHDFIEGSCNGKDFYFQY